MGLNSIVVRNLVNKPDTVSVVLGTAFVIQLIGGLMAFGLAVFAIGLVRPDDALAKLAVSVLGFVMVFRSSEVIKYWFESQVTSKYTVIVESSAFLLFATVKVILILSQASLISFVWIIFIEAAVVAISLLGIYAWRGGSLRAWYWNSQHAKSLLKDSWPLILSGLAIMVYMRIDQIMIGQMLGDEAVGIYTAAVRISEVWYFIPIAIAASVFPAIIEAKKRSEMSYYKRLQIFYDLMVVIAIIVAVPVTFVSNWVVILLFGEAYQQAGVVLSIHVWAGVFVFIGVASNNWLILENYQSIVLYTTLLGAILNVSLNVLFIPSWGGNRGGAGNRCIPICSRLFHLFIP